MLPGGRDIENPEHRAYVAGVWGIDEADLPHKGTSMEEMVWQMADGEIRGLLGMCNNPFVSLPNQARSGPATRRWSSMSSRTSSCPRRPPGPTWSCPPPSGPRTRA